MEYAKRLRNATIIGTPVLKAAEEIPQLRIRELRETQALPAEEEKSSHGEENAEPSVHGEPSGHAAPAEHGGHGEPSGHSGH
jgi:hypothetical protein